MPRTITTGIDNGVNVEVDDNGFIHFDGRVMNPLQARNVAAALTLAIRMSRDRDQIDTPTYYNAANINRRAETPIGEALAALGRIF